MVTSAPLRRAAHAVVAVAIAGPAVLLGSGVAWAAPSPPPAPAADASVDTLVAPAEPAAAPAEEPAIGTWITGGTLQEGSAAKPAAAPVTRAVAPATTTRSTTRTRTTRPATHRHATRTAPDGATVLPFTGGPVDVLLPGGIALLVGGIALTLVARPRPTHA